ncbi:MAG TPA: UDP-N-acetylenolpyruvoylglucosamine reductase [Chitinophagaceae bacterium]|nr:UDP-N-acetylenolpyruvoylglucosamine reductase [Chitinophagaceae bacterium]
MFTENYPLRSLNSFHMDVKARYFAAFHSVDALREQIDEMNRHPRQVPRMVLGGGSNILFTKDPDAFILKNDIPGIEQVGEDNGYVYLKSGAGVNWHSFVMHCINENLAGVENLSLIPGNVGASPMQNIGAYGVEIRDVFHELEAIDLHSGELVRFGLNDCAFGYRESVFKNKYKHRFAIVSVTFRLSKKPNYHISYGAIRQELEAMDVQDLSIRAVSDAVIRIRKSKLPDPDQIGNAGSFFKNPEISQELFQSLLQQYPGIPGYPTTNGQIKIAAGWLIEHSGPSEGQSWKGYREGDAGCHAKQALVLVNYGSARGEEIASLSQRIAVSVSKKYGIQLETEVNII